MQLFEKNLMAIQDLWVKPGFFFALVRELLSLAHCAASGANGEAGPKGERRRRESRK